MSESQGDLNLNLDVAELGKQDRETEASACSKSVISKELRYSLGPFVVSLIAFPLVVYDLHFYYIICTFSAPLHPRLTLVHSKCPLQVRAES